MHSNLEEPIDYIRKSTYLASSSF